MTANFVADNCRLVGAHLPTTDNTTIFTATGYVQVISIKLSNLTAYSAALVNVSWFSVSQNEEFLLLFRHRVPPNGAVEYMPQAFSLGEGDELRAQAIMADTIDVVVSVAEVPGRSG